MRTKNLLRGLGAVVELAAMKKKLSPQPPENKIKRKNITMHPDVLEILEKQAAENYSTASAMLTRYVMDAEKEKDPAKTKPLQSVEDSRPRNKRHA